GRCGTSFRISPLSMAEKRVLYLIQWSSVAALVSSWLWVARSEPQRWAWTPETATEPMRHSQVTLQFSPPRPSFLRDVPPRGTASTPQVMSPGIRRSTQKRGFGDLAVSEALYREPLQTGKQLALFAGGSVMIYPKCLKQSGLR